MTWQIRDWPVGFVCAALQFSPLHKDLGVGGFLGFTKKSAAIHYSYTAWVPGGAWSGDRARPAGKCREVSRQWIAEPGRQPRERGGFAAWFFLEIRRLFWTAASAASYRCRDFRLGYVRAVPMEHCRSRNSSPSPCTCYSRASESGRRLARSSCRGSVLRRVGAKNRFMTDSEYLGNTSRTRRSCRSHPSPCSPSRNGARSSS